MNITGNVAHIPGVPYKEGYLISKGLVSGVSLF